MGRSHAWHGPWRAAGCMGRGPVTCANQSHVCAGRSFGGLAGGTRAARGRPVGSPKGLPKHTLHRQEMNKGRPLRACPELCNGLSRGRPETPCTCQKANSLSSRGQRKQSLGNGRPFMAACSRHTQSPCACRVNGRRTGLVGCRACWFGRAPTPTPAAPSR